MNTLFRFDTSNIRGDLFGGLTAGIVALPLALAFGVQSGLGAAAGIYGAMVIGVIAAWLGGTPTQVSGPTGPMTVVSAALVASMIRTTGSIEAGMSAVLMTFLIAGAIQIILGVVKVGKYIRLIPRTVISGFMSGIGIIILLLQIFPVLGHSSPASVIDVLLQIQEPLNAIDVHAVILAAITLAIILIFPKITKKIPGTLVALITVSILPFALDWNVPLIGEIPNGLPELKISKMFNIDTHLWSTIFSDAVALAVLGSLDSLLTSLVADSMTRTRHDSERELIGQGIGNMAASFIGGIPGAGATMRTVVNIQSGGRTRISGIAHGLFLLVVLLGLGTWAAMIPLAVLAGILVSVGIGILDINGFKQLRFAPKADAVVLVLVLIFTVFFDLIQAVALGLALASLLFMKRMADENTKRSDTLPLTDLKLDEYDVEEEKLVQVLKGKVHIHNFHGPLHFGFTSSMQDMAAAFPNKPHIVLRMRDVPFMDLSGLIALKEIVYDLDKKGTELYITGLQPQPAQMMSDLHVAPGLIDQDHILTSLEALLPIIQKREQAIS